MPQPAQRNNACLWTVAAKRATQPFCDVPFFINRPVIAWLHALGPMLAGVLTIQEVWSAS